MPKMITKEICEHELLTRVTFSEDYSSLSVEDEMPLMICKGIRDSKGTGRKYKFSDVIPHRLYEFLKEGRVRDEEISEDIVKYIAESFTSKKKPFVKVEFDANGEMKACIDNLTLVDKKLSKDLMKKKILTPLATIIKEGFES